MLQKGWLFNTLSLKSAEVAPGQLWPCGTGQHCCCALVEGRNASIMSLHAALEDRALSSRVASNVI